jgi:hypothetical protein
MKRLLFTMFFWSALLACHGGLAADPVSPPPPGDKQGDEEVSKPRKFAVGPTAINVISMPSGLKTLNIHFRWSLFPDSRIEVRLVPGTEDKSAAVAPTYFHEHLKGKVQDNLFDCLDHADDGGKVHSFTKDKIVYTMIGRRNSAGNQGVHVSIASETPKKSDKPAAVFLQMDTWAIDKDTLSLDLPRDEFAQPGTLFVWFFRGSKVVWEEQVKWPGYK